MPEDDDYTAAQQLFQHTPHEYWKILYESPLPIFVVSPDAQLLDVNPALAGSLGYASPREMFHSADTMAPQLFAVPQDCSVVQRLLEKNSELVNYACYLRRKDGSSVWRSIHARTVRDERQQVLHYQGFLLEVSDHEAQKLKTEFKQRVHERTAYDLIDNIPIGTFAIRLLPDGRPQFDFFSRRLLSMFSVEQDAVQLNPLSAFEKVHPEDYDAFIALNIDSFLKRLPFRWEGRVISNNDIRWFVIESTPRDLPDGAIIWEGIVTDITDHKRAEEALRQSEVQYRTLTENMNDILWTIDLNLNITYLSPSVEKVLGFTVEERVRMPLEEQMPPEMLLSVTDRLAEELAFDPERDPERHTILELDYYHRNGSIRCLETDLTFIRDEQGKPVGIQAMSRDITDRKRLEEELLRTEKLESLGILAGGIAHDFNNLMASVQGYIDLALLDMPSDTVACERLEAALYSLAQTRELTGRLITFSRGGDPWKKTIDLADLIKDVAHRAVKGSGVRAFFDFSDDLWPVEADEHQMRQCFFNLANNAVEAMPDGGVLTVAAGNRVIASGEVPDLPAGSYLRITLSDEGVGIPPEIKSKLFDPYFTTKGMGAQKGTGLGLPVCYSVLKRHGGAITVTSRPGEGAAFVIYLPAGAEMVNAFVDTRPAGHGRILIMDDEPRLREIQRAFLERLGYEVVDVADGREAVAVYKEALESGIPFDLVVLDLTVHGGMGGQAAMEELLQINPDVRAVIASGYIDDPVVEHYTEYGFRGALKKPFSSEDLKQLLNAALK